MAESTEQLHERVEEMKNEMWEIAMRSSFTQKNLSLTAYYALETLAGYMHKQIQREAKRKEQLNG